MPPVFFREKRQLFLRNEIKTFVRVSSEIFNTYSDTLKTWKNRRHCLGSEVTGCVINMNPAHYFNVLDPAKSMYRFTMVLKFCFLKGISSQWNFYHEFFPMCGVCLKWCIDLPNFPIWGLFIDQVLSVIILINTKTKRILHNTKSQLFKDRPFLGFISNYFWNTFLSSEKAVTLLVVFKYQHYIDTERWETVTYVNTLISIAISMMYFFIEEL